MTIIYIDTNSKFYDWAEENGYDYDTEYDLEEEVHKRGAHVCYIKKLSEETYAQVNWYQDYYNGRMYIEIVQEGLVRKVEQVVTEQVSYV